MVESGADVWQKRTSESKSPLMGSAATSSLSATQSNFGHHGRLRMSNILPLGQPPSVPRGAGYLRLPIQRGKYVYSCRYKLSQRLPLE